MPEGHCMTLSKSAKEWNCLRHEVKSSGEKIIAWNDEDKESAKALVAYLKHFSDKTATNSKSMALDTSLVQSLVQMDLLNVSTLFQSWLIKHVNLV